MHIFLCHFSLYSFPNQNYCSFGFPDFLELGAIVGFLIISVCLCCRDELSPLWDSAMFGSWNFQFKGFWAPNMEFVSQMSKCPWAGLGSRQYFSQYLLSENPCLCPQKPPHCNFSRHEQRKRNSLYKYLQN